MRELKDKERILLIAKVFLDLKGPATAKEICDYIESSPVRIQKWVSPLVLSGLLKAHKDIESSKEKNRSSKYWIKR